MNYKLPGNTHEAIFQGILENALWGKTPVENPTAIILGGQPGAGKTALLEYSSAAFSDGNIVTINGDDFRYWHPQSREILERCEKDFSHLTDPDVRVWTRRVFEFAINSKFNIVFEGTMRTDAICGTLQRLMQQYGYRTLVRVLAIHGRWSAAGILHRYEWMRKASGYGRWTKLDDHEASYLGMPQTVAHIESGQLAHEIGVYNRNLDVLYHNRLEDGGWLYPMGAEAAIWEERKRAMSPSEVTLFLQEWQAILCLMDERTARSDELEFASTLAKHYP